MLGVVIFGIIFNMMIYVCGIKNFDFVFGGYGGIIVNVVIEL